jgi:hypothetical protein
LTTFEPTERGFATEIWSGVDEPVGYDRSGHIVAKQHFHYVCEVFLYVVMLRLKGGTYLLGQLGADAKDIAATEQTFVAAAQIFVCFQPCPEWPNKDDFGIHFGRGVIGNLLGVDLRQ